MQRPARIAGAGRARRVVALVVALAGATPACAPWPGPAGAASARVAGPDEREPVTMVPAGVETVIDLDMAALRTSPWALPLLRDPDPTAQANKASVLGFDDVDDVDRIVYAVPSGAASDGAATLVVARGRFDEARLGAAFRSRFPAATVDTWHGVSVLTAGENAVALFGAKTFASGPPALLRAIVERGFGNGPAAVEEDDRGTLMRDLVPPVEGQHAAILATVRLDDRLRARARDTFAVPSSLRLLGVRLDVGRDLHGEALGFLTDHAAASQLAHRVDASIRDRTTRLALMVMGLQSLSTDTRVIVDGARVRVIANVTEEQRPVVTQLLSGLARQVR